MDLAAGDLRSGKQTGGAMANVVVSHSCWQTEPHGQGGLSAVARLDLGLFVHAEHQGMLRRVQITPHDVGHFGLKLRVGTELEGFNPVWLQPVFLQDPMNPSLGQTPLADQPACAPMRGVGRRFKRRCHHCLLLGCTNRARATIARLGAQRRYATPLANSGGGKPQSCWTNY